MKRKFFYGMAAMAALGMTACSNEDLPVENGGDLIPDGDKTYYLNVAVRGDMPGTRTAEGDGNPAEGDTDFQNGNGNESKINNAFFVFYNEDGEMIGNIVQVDLGDPKPVATPDGTVENYYYKVVRVDTYKGQGKPKQVMCYINPATPESLQNPLSTIQTVTRERAVIGNGENMLFPMSNSVYYAPVSATDNTLEVKMAVPINEDQVFDTEADAEKAALAADKTDATEAEKAKVLNIYVERRAAKLTFKLGDGVVTPYKTTTKSATIDVSTQKYPDIDVELAFVYDGWGLNAEAKTVYAVKSFREPTGTGGMLQSNYTYKKLDNRINAKTLPWDKNTNQFDDPADGDVLTPSEGAWTWNNAYYHRSYWAISTAYFDSEYPEVESDLDIHTNQNYLSYKDIKAQNNDKTGSTPYYYKETTVGIPAIASKNPAAAMPSVALIGHYTVKVNGTALTDANTTFYTYLNNASGKPYVYFENDPTATDKSTSKVSNTMSILYRMLLQQTVLYRRTERAKDASGNTLYDYARLNVANEDDRKVLLDILEIAQPTAEVKNAATAVDVDPVKVADRMRTLQFKDGATIPSFVVMANGNGYKEIVNTIGKDDVNATLKIDLDHANAALMNQVGYAVKYNTGKCFFNIPVKHLGWYRNGNKQKFKEGSTTEQNTKAINWDIVRLGDFGMVRNHSYKIEVNSISGLATGIANEETPIIPPADTQDYYMVYRVNILKWALVPTQGVDL